MPKLFIFPLSNPEKKTNAIDSLRAGLSKTIHAFPLLAGTVQELAPTPDHPQKGRLCVDQPWHTMREIFNVQDLTKNDSFDYSDLQATNFPIHNLDVATLLPSGLTMKPHTKCAMLVQVNIIRGGLIVVHSLSHGFMDGGSMTVIAKAWAAFCRGEDGSRFFTPQVSDRSRLMQGTTGASVANFPELTNNNTVEIPASPAKSAPAPPTKMEIFFFSREKLAELKRLASAPTQEAQNGDWISTSDALCALLSTCIQRTRDKPRPLTLGLAMDFRGAMDPPLPADYIGNAVHMLYIPLPHFPSSQNIQDQRSTISTTAHLIRQRIKTVTQEYMHRIIGALNSPDIQDISKVFHTRAAPAGADSDFVTITSWARQPLYEFDWGEDVGGRMERVRVRRPLYPNLVLIAPMLTGVGFGKELEGGVEVIFGLEEERMERLMGMEGFGRFAMWEGK